MNYEKIIRMKYVKIKKEMRYCGGSGQRRKR